MAEEIEDGKMGIEDDAEQSKQATKAKSRIDKENGDSGIDDEGVDVHPDFQVAAHKLTHKASKHEISHLRGKINEREDSMREEESKKMRKGGGGEFSMGDAPSSVGTSY